MAARREMCAADLSCGGLRCPNHQSERRAAASAPGGAQLEPAAGRPGRTMRNAVITTPSDAAQKRDFVGQAAAIATVAAGLGHRMQCRCVLTDRRRTRANYVVAMDADHVAIDRLYRALRANASANILPLVFNVTDPSPGLGWRNLERKRLVERGRPDLVLALALIHHVVIGGNIPMAEFLHWLSDLGGDPGYRVRDARRPDGRDALAQQRGPLRRLPPGCIRARACGCGLPSCGGSTLGSGTRVMYHARPISTTAS